MSELTVASRYAKSLIDLAVEQNILGDIKSDMDLFYSTLKAHTELQAVLKNPIISLDKKAGVLDDLFKKRVNKATDSFFHIMVNKGRSGLLYGTAREFLNQYNVKMGIITVRVTSAAKLSDANRSELIDRIKEATGSQVVLKEKVDPELIGGFVLNIGDRQIDTSIEGSLNRLKKEFSQKVTGQI